MTGLNQGGHGRKGPGFVDKECRSVDFFTPKKVLDRVDPYFFSLNQRGIDLDPATAPDNPTGAKKFFTLEDDGLSKDWFGNVFVNPPYGKALREWAWKINAEAAKGRPIVALLPGQRFEQAYWQKALFIEELTALVMIRSRLQFGVRDEAGAIVPSKGGNPYGSILWVFNGNLGAAAEAFSPLGAVVEIGEIVHRKEAA